VRLLQVRLRGVLPSRYAEDLYAGWWRLIAELEGRGYWCGMDGATFGCWQHMLRLPRDHYLRMDGNDCAVHPAAPRRFKNRDLGDVLSDAADTN
jgi:hypothetical protein